MKVLFTLVVGAIAVCGLLGGAVLAGIIHVPSGAVSNFQAQLPTLPALQPLPAQASDTSDMTITLSERFLNNRIAIGVPSTAQISNAQLDLHAGNLADFSATVNTGFINVNPKATVLLSVRNGRIVLDVQKVDVGGFGVPSSLIQPQIDQLKQTAETALNNEFAQLQASTGLTLQALSTTENSLTLYFAQ